MNYFLYSQRNVNCSWSCLATAWYGLKPVNIYKKKQTSTSGNGLGFVSSYCSAMSVLVYFRLFRMVTDLAYMNETFPLVDVSLLKVRKWRRELRFVLNQILIAHVSTQFKERDMLEGVLKFWRNTDGKLFDITKCWWEYLASNSSSTVCGKTFSHSYRKHPSI